MALRIAMVLAPLDVIDGGARAALNLADAWLRLGHAVEMVFLRHMGDPRLPLPPGLAVTELAIGKGVGVKPLADYLEARRPHLIFSSTHVPNLAALRARRMVRRRIPLIVQSADFVSRRVPKAETRVRVWRQMERWYPRADVITALSSDLADEMSREAGIDASRIHIVPNPLRLNLIARESRQPPPHEWFTDVAEPVLLSVGSLTQQKNHALALQAFALLRRRRSAKLVILGEGPMRGRLEGIVRRLGLEADVAMPGHLPNPFACMRHADLLVHAARFESFGNVLVEALACGLPVVAVECDGGPRDILTGGIGTLVPTRRPADLARAIAAALDQPPPPDSLRRRARDFGHLQVARAYLRLIRSARGRLQPRPRPDTQPD
jgi:glycosyltransferase involved in cell wall biosynthesis